MMKTNNTEKLKKRKDDYSWLKVHLGNIKSEILILVAGIISNFRKVSWHKKDLTHEYLAMIFIIVFLSIFSYLIYMLVGLIQ